MKKNVFFLLFLPVLAISQELDINSLEELNFKLVSEEEISKIIKQQEPKVLQAKIEPVVKTPSNVINSIDKKVEATLVVAKVDKGTAPKKVVSQTVESKTTKVNIEKPTMVEKQQVVSEKKKEVVFVATPHETCQTLEELLVFSVENFEKILSKSDLQEELVVKAKKDKRLDIKLIETMKITKENLKELLNVVRELR
jgi:hypothetical protein